MSELGEAHTTNTRLQTRVDELTEDISLQASFSTKNTPASLLSELEQSGVVISDEIDLQLNNNDVIMNDNDTSNNLKQELWEAHEKAQAICTTVKKFVHK